MDTFRFSPELFEHRNEVMEALEQAGFHWMSHYSSVDCLHDLYGIEVCGIHQKPDAVTIRNILAKLFPDWISCRLMQKDGGREPGWIARIHRDKPRRQKQWETT